jgi:hypothetical protein
MPQPQPQQMMMAAPESDNTLIYLGIAGVVVAVVLLK